MVMRAIESQAYHLQVPGHTHFLDLVCLANLLCETVGEATTLRDRNERESSALQVTEIRQRYRGATGGLPRRMTAALSILSLIRYAAG